MSAASNPFLTAVCIATFVYILLLVLRALLSITVLMGFRPPIGGPARRTIELVEDVTEPALRPLRRVIPPVGAGGVGIDLSLMVATIILIVVRIAIGC